MNNMKILYGTANRAKLNLMKNVTAPLNIDIICLDDLEQSLPEIVENGKNPLENAEIKARAYYKAFSMPVFSCDSGLYFDGLDEALQPGTYVRRVNGRELTERTTLHDNMDIGLREFFENALSGLK